MLNVRKAFARLRSMASSSRTVGCTASLTTPCCCRCTFAIEVLMFVERKVERRKAGDEMFFVIVSQVLTSITLSSRLISTFTCSAASLHSDVGCTRVVRHAQPPRNLGWSLTIFKVHCDTLKNQELATFDVRQCARIFGGVLPSIHSQFYKKCSLVGAEAALCICMYLEENKKGKSRREYH